MGIVKKGGGCFNIGDFALPDLEEKTGNSTSDNKLAAIKCEIENLRSQLRKKEKTIFLLKKEFKRLVEDEKEKSFEKGFKKGCDETTKSLAVEFENNILQLSEKVNQIIGDVASSKSNVILSAERAVLELVFLIAEKVLGKEIDRDKKAILPVIDGMLPYIDACETINIIAHPKDVEVLKKHESLWIPMAIKRSDICYEEKESIKRGGLVIKTNSGIVDARLEVQLDHIKAKFVELWVAAVDE